MAGAKTAFRLRVGGRIGGTCMAGAKQERITYDSLRLFGLFEAQKLLSPLGIV